MGRYDDILHLPHHTSPTRPRMSRENRAAQFAPFAALSGHEEAMIETARLTVSSAELDESRKDVLNKKLLWLLQAPGRPEITVTYFRPDDKKAGGAYCNVAGQLKKADPYHHTILLEDGTSIPIEQVYEIDCDCFPPE